MATPSSPSATPDLGGRSAVRAATQGPPVSQWEALRAVIIAQYRCQTMEDMRRYMSRHHQFHASARMYFRKLKQWQVFKNLKQSDKLKLFEEMQHPAKSWGRSSRSPPALDVKGLEKTLRGIRSIIREQQRASSDNEGSENVRLRLATAKDESASPPAGASFVSNQQRPSSFVEECSDLEDGSTFTPSSPSESSSHGSPVRTTLPMPPERNHRWKWERRSHASSYRMDMQDMMRHSSCSPGRTISFNIPATAAQRVMHIVRDYVGGQLDANPSHSEILHLDSSVESRAFWGNIRTGIYTLKISNSLAPAHRRGWEAINKACDSTLSALSAIPLDFVPRLLHTLSPTNAPHTVCPALRNHLLKHIGDMVVERYHNPVHPIAEMCRYLRQDGNDEDVSKQALTLVRDILREKLGSSNRATFNLDDLLVVQTRRSGDFDGAVRMARSFQAATRRNFAAGSDQLRIADNTLVHALMARKEYVEALPFCMNIVKRPDGGLYNDDTASYAMEDIAEIYGRVHLIGEAMLWLERAAAIAIRLRGPEDFSTRHVIDKLKAHQQWAEGLNHSTAVLGWGGCDSTLPGHGVFYDEESLLSSLPIC